jgi:aryl-alcohol dehydrogenase-like predicted oxidoreductase
MRRIGLAHTGEEVSQLCLGCMWMGTRTDTATSFAMLDRFVAEGGDFLDTANCYAWWVGKGEFLGDESETTIGDWMKRRGNRDRIFLATKVGARLRDPHGIRDEQGVPDWDRLPDAYEHLTATEIRIAIDASLRRLQADHVDLYYTHIDDRSTPLEETLGALNELVDAGKVRFVGCSNARTWRLERARRISAERGWSAYVAWQQQYSYLRPKTGADFGVGVNVDSEQLDYLRANRDIALVAYSPLLGGSYDDEAKRDSHEKWPLFDSEDARARLRVLTSVAASLAVTRNQLVLAWLLHHDPPVIPILRARTGEQLEENLGALEITLTPDQIGTLSSAAA